MTNTSRNRPPATGIRTVGTLLVTSLRKGAGLESVKQLLGHSSITTKVDAYGHLTVEDARQSLEAAGWFTGREVRL
jgi:integrase